MRCNIKELLKNITHIIGFDFGHGESAAQFVQIRYPDGSFVENGEIKSLELLSNTPKIMTIIAYKSDNTIDSIGNCSSLAIGSRVFSCFKKSPEEWDNIIPASCLSEHKKTYKEAMGDFIGTASENIFRLNPELKNVSKDNIAFFVGCPSDETWSSRENREKYEKLISGKTGIRLENVVVVPESTAAIFSAVRAFSAYTRDTVTPALAQVPQVPEGATGGNAPWLKGVFSAIKSYNAAIQMEANLKNLKTLNLTKGIAVLDFGSSTADFTYIRPGEKIIELSRTLGASYIEENMLFSILADEENIWQGDLLERQLHVRVNGKEAWFIPGRYTDDEVSLQVTYVKTDENGNVVTDPRGRPARHVVSTYVDYDMINNAICEATGFSCEVKEGGRVVSPDCDLSWKEHCRSFLEKCHSLIKAEGYDKVIVTGGAANMPFLAGLVKEIFDKKGEGRVIRDKSPSYCVCAGLCQVGINHAKMAALKAEEKANTEAYIKKLENHLADGLADMIYNKLFEIAAANPGIKLGNFLDKVGTSLQYGIAKETRRKVCETALKKFSKDMENITLSVTDKAVKAMYGDSSMGEAFRMQKFSADIKGSEGEFNTGSVRNSLFQGSLEEFFDLAISDSLYDQFVAVLGGVFEILTGGLFTVAIDYVTKHFTTVNREYISNNFSTYKIKSSLGNTPSKMVQSMFDDDGDNTKLRTMIEEEIDRALEVVALEYFEEKNGIKKGGRKN
ncbi:MAG: cell division FtsA domain-containing protein [Clostridia bacterium]|nr:cell division FtsA domain-containing protein [Clostridia bacterium]